MDEDGIATPLRHDETEAAVVVPPLQFAFESHGSM
jgi:hypothetical protein